MRKWYQLVKHQPRSIRAVSNLFLLALVMLLFYISVDSPAISPVQQLRKVEKANLVGPAKILDKISLETYTGYYPCNRLILAASDDGVTLFQYDDKDLEYNKLVYRKKQGDVTVLSLPITSLTTFSSATYLEVPVIVFDSFPKAVRAEMEIELPTLYNGKEVVFQKEYESTAARDTDGYFLFTLSAEPVGSFDRLGWEGQAFDILTEVSNDDPRRSYVMAIPVTLRFFDQNDKMIAERNVEIRSPASEAHAKEQGDT